MLTMIHQHQQQRQSSIVQGRQLPLGWRLHSTAPSTEPITPPPPPPQAAAEAAPAAAAPEQPGGGKPSSSWRRKSKEWQGPLAYHQELTLRVESLTNLGMGVCRVDLPASGDDDGDDGPQRWVVMVPTVVPGELVRVKVYRNHKNYSEADLLEVLEPSPDRVEPRCPVRAVCCV